MLKDDGVISLNVVLERLLAGTHNYKVQDFRNALIALEREGKLVRVNPRKNARSFNESDLFKIV